MHLTTLCRRFGRCPIFQNLGQTTTLGTMTPTFLNKCVGSLMSPTNQYQEDARDGT